jgi:hypothetical protein
MQKQQSTGTTAALATGVTGYLITILMWVCEQLSIKMDLTVATAFVSVAVMIAGGIGHYIDVKIERALHEESSNSGASGGGQPPA